MSTGDTVQFIFKRGTWLPLPGDTQCLLPWDGDPILSLHCTESLTSIHNETPSPCSGRTEGPDKAYFVWGQSKGAFLK